MNFDQATWALWISIASVIVASVSAFFSRSSAVTANKALAISNQQEARKKPALVPYLAGGYFKKINERNTKIYGFSILISNPTDIDNAVAHLELEISYVTVQNVCMKLKILHEDKLVNDFGGGSIKPLTIPLPIPSHQAVAGWTLFNACNALLGDCKIDSYSIRITDAHGFVTLMESDLVKEFMNV